MGCLSAFPQVGHLVSFLQVGEILLATSSSSTEDDGAVVALLTFWVAMAEVKAKEVTAEDFCADRRDRVSAQSATSKSVRGSMHLDPHQFLQSEQLFPKCMIPAC